MKLYDAMTPNSLRVHVFLAEKGIDVDREKIDVLGGETRTPDFLAINSLGELPVLETDDGHILTESVAISRYLEELYPKPPLMGESAYDQARIEMWNRRMEQQIFGPIGNVGRHTLPFFADKVEQLADFAKSQTRLFDSNWAWLDRELSDGRPFVAGDAFSIADITGMAALFVCDILQKTLPGDANFANRWARTMKARESFASRMVKAA